MTVAKTSLVSAWFKNLVGQDNFTLMDTRTHGVGEQALNQIASVAPVYGRNPDGSWTVLQSLASPPGDLDTIDVMWLTEVEQINQILELAYANRGFFMQRLLFKCPPTDNRALWQQLFHYRVVFDSGTLAAGPNLDGSDATMENSVTLKAVEYAHLKRVSLSSLTTTETEDMLCVDGVGGYYDCLGGWAGSDQLMVFGGGSTAAAGEAWYSKNGGGTISAFITDPTPFTEVAGLNCAQIFLLSDTQVRVVYGRETEAATKAMFAYQDFNFADATWTAASWNVITIDATSVADATESIAKWDGLDRGYIAAAGDIYVSTDTFETDPGAAIFTGSNAIAGFAKDGDENVWAFGAAGAILREMNNARGTFAARTPPAGGAAVTAMTFANDGTVFAGIGTKVYKSETKAATAASWVELYDFGASHKVVSIRAKNGTTQCLRCWVDDTTPGVGSVYESEDGGNIWRLVTETANAGYNQVYQRYSNYNEDVAVGDDDGSTAIVELLA